MTVDMSEIKIGAPDSYFVVLNAQSGSVKATFNVEVSPRRRHSRFGPSKEFNRETLIEKLESEARESIKEFCRNLATK